MSVNSTMQAKVNSGNPQTHAVFFLLRRCNVIFFHYIICGGKSLINNTRVKIRYFSSVFDIANQLLKSHTFLATLSGWWMYDQAFTILKTRSFAIRTSRVLASTTWARVDMEFLFSCSIWRTNIEVHGGYAKLLSCDFAPSDTKWPILFRKY